MYLDVHLNSQKPIVGIECPLPSLCIYSSHKGPLPESGTHVSARLEISKFKWFPPSLHLHHCQNWVTGICRDDLPNRCEGHRNYKARALSSWWWCTPLVPAEAGGASLQSEFKDSQGYTEKSCLVKPKNKIKQELLTTELSHTIFVEPLVADKPHKEFCQHSAPAFLHMVLCC